jgi:sterol desaturase/sphingolipid hydroxylase (fatty acid hydroxylase superfamily)
MRFVIRHFAYPIVAFVTLAYLWREVHLPLAQMGTHHGWFVGGLVVSLMLLEALWPLEARWRMNRRLFLRRDLPFLMIGGATITAGNAVASRVLLQHGSATPTTWLTDLPVMPAAFITLLITDGLWYGVHRTAHEGKGLIGRWLWRMHAAHHLPGQVYVLMHAVAHPLNTVIVRLLLTVPPWLMGVRPEALFVANVITGVQGLVSHFNVDSRVGWINHLLTGTELHRWHHAAGTLGNYGAVLSIWDQLWGSFVYRPCENPDRLGLDEPSNYPRDTEIWQVLREPLGFAPQENAHRAPR